MKDTDALTQYLKDSINLKQRILLDTPLLQNILKAAEACLVALRSGNKIMLAGNGGSAADAQHIASEFVVKFNFDRNPLSAMALTVDTSMLTAVSNDYGFDDVFSRQLLANGKRGDIFIGISTSGNSSNILKAIEAASQVGITTIALCGNRGRVHDCADIVLAIPGDATSHIQEAHITVGHFICSMIEQKIFNQ